MSRTKSPIPHSWSINDWPQGVHPGNSARGRYLIRTNKCDLLAAGALARVGRELVVLGDRYTRWLERQASRVPEFEIAPNRERDSAAA